MYPSSIAFAEAAAKPESTSPEAEFELRPTARGSYELKLRGQFPPKWLANLTSALAARGISVHRGEARKVTPSLWQATFEIAPADGGRLPAGLDWLALARTAPPATPAGSSIRLDACTLEQRGDALYVEVEGPDSVGFLVALLKQFAFFSLFPAEVRIDTPGGKVHDHFRLRGVGGMAPSDSSIRGLEIELKKLLR